MKITGKILAVLLCTASMKSWAGDPVSLGQPIYGGNGCPQGTASAVLSPDNSTLTILFDQYVAQAGRSTGQPFDRKSCNLAIPVHIPQGLSVSVLQVDYRGTNILPRDAQSRINISYFFAGSQGPAMSKVFRGPLNQDYLVPNTLMAGGIVWSPCGLDTNLRANTNIMVQTNRNLEEAMMTVDSVDVKAALVYHLQWRSCGI